MNPEQVIWGSMRIAERRQPKHYWRNFLILIHGIGIRKIHSSNEYESFPLLCEVLGDLRADGIDFHHVVKLPEPHFGRHSFDQAEFDRKLDLYLNTLQTERIDTVQWMWRGDIKDEAKRISGFRTDRDAIDAAFGRGCTKKAISRLMCFPYSPAFGAAALEEAWCAGLVVYLNYYEREYLDVCERANDIGKEIMALRPFFGGKVLKDQDVNSDDALRWVLTQPGVTEVVTTFSAAEHIPEVRA